MQWGALCLAIVATYVLQAGMLWMFGLTWFDPFLLLTLLLGLLTAAPQARLAGWVVGLAQDLGSQDVLGIHAFTLGLTALLATQLRRVFNVNVWWARVVVLLLAAWPPQVLYLLHLNYWVSQRTLSLGVIVERAAWLSVATAAVTMFVLTLPWVVAWRRRRRAMRGAF